MSFNEGIIDEFRSNGGKVGGRFQGAPMVLVHHRGKKTGTERVSPLVYLALDDERGFAVFGSKGGAPTDPQWVGNLLANPDTEVELGRETIPVTARLATGDERERLWSIQKERMPGFAEYEKTAGAAGREIPVVVLERRDA